MIFVSTGGNISCPNFTTIKKESNIYKNLSIVKKVFSDENTQDLNIF